MSCSTVTSLCALWTGKAVSTECWRLQPLISDQPQMLHRCVYLTHCGGDMEWWDWWESHFTDSAAGMWKYVILGKVKNYRILPALKLFGSGTAEGLFIQSTFGCCSPSPCSHSFLPFTLWLAIAVPVSANGSSHLQKGPSSGTDRVKKGGSYMCHKVLWNSRLHN